MSEDMPPTFVGLTVSKRLQRTPWDWDISHMSEPQGNPKDIMRECGGVKKLR